MEPNRAKAFGGVGSILSAVGLSIVGYILALIGLRGLGKYYNDEDLRRNSLKWFIFGYIGLIATIAVFIVTLSRTYDTLAYSIVWPFIILADMTAGTIVALIVAEIFYVISAVYLKKVYATLAARTGEGLFNTAVKLYWWGAVLTIVLVGLYLTWISWIVSAVAFFSMTMQRSEAAPPPPG